MKKIDKKLDLSLLYVEDEPFIRQNAVEFLEDKFKTIYEASDGKEALKIYYETKPDIIITDIQMPYIDGLEFCKKIRESDETTPIIITTAFADPKYLFKAIELNLVKYLTKPIEEEALNEALSLCVKKIQNQDKSVERLSNEHYFDYFNKTLLHQDTFIKLTAKEEAFLMLLISQKNRVVSYKEIENQVYEGEYMSEDALKALVKNLRKKISKECLQNHSKLGYKIKLYHG
jgi:DNA-binding response OmpR family regulator